PGETVCRVAGNGFAELDERLVVAPGEVENEARVRADLGRAGVDAARFPHFPQGIIGASLGDEREGVTLPGAGRARIERDRAAALALRAAPVPLEEELLEAERAVRRGERSVERDRADRGSLGLRDRVGEARPEREVAVGQSRVGRGERWIRLDGPLEELDRLLQARVVPGLDEEGRLAVVLVRQSAPGPGLPVRFLRYREDPGGERGGRREDKNQPATRTAGGNGRLHGCRLGSGEAVRRSFGGSRRRRGGEIEPVGFVPADLVSEPVPDLRHRLDVSVAVRTVAERLAQEEDVLSEVALLDKGVRPERGEQLLLR